MTFDRDPYAVLGLETGASQSDVKRAYRRLAKAFHPDAAGPAAMPRFLSIQAAYERLTGDAPATPDGRRPSRREPWRADATREAWQARGTRRSGRRTGTPGAGGRAGTADPGAGPSEPGTRPPGARRRSRGGDRGRDKATPGSTSYDDAEPFDQEWSGASWYGQSSGTYWTINPKEYADPRKHGPEYQARARRAGQSTGGYDGDPAPVSGTAHAEPGTTHGGGAGADWSGATRDTTGGPAAAAPDSAPSAARAVPAEPQPYLPLPGLSGGAGARIAVALLGWPPIGLVLAWWLGEASGCSRFSAICTEPTDALTIGTWFGQIVIVSLLLLVPRLAAIASGGTLGALVAAVPGTILLSASGGARQPEASALVLAAFLFLGWVGGVSFAIAGRSRTIRA